MFFNDVLNLFQMGNILYIIKQNSRGKNVIIKILY